VSDVQSDRSVCRVEGGCRGVVVEPDVVGSLCLDLGEDQMGLLGAPGSKQDLCQTAPWIRCAGLGYEGESEVFTIPHKKPANVELTVDQHSFNAVHGALRCLAERANSLVKTTYKVLRRYRGDPWRLGGIVAAALVLLHHENHRTT
jgi:hypothetical protein